MSTSFDVKGFRGGADSKFEGFLPGSLLGGFVVDNGGALGELLGIPDGNPLPIFILERISSCLSAARLLILSPSAVILGGNEIDDRLSEGLDAEHVTDMPLQLEIDTASLISIPDGDPMAASSPALTTSGKALSLCMDSFAHCRGGLEIPTFKCDRIQGAGLSC
jgi:hypothetical protein